MRKLITSVIGMSLLVTGAQSAVAAERFADIGVNAKLAEMGANVGLAYAELSVSKEGSFDTMKLVFFKDVGNKQLPSHWVPGDPRNDVGQGPAMLHITDTVDGAANCSTAANPSCTIDAATTSAVIAGGMDEWDAIGCATLPLVNVGAYEEDFGFVQWLVFPEGESEGYFGGSEGFFPFITHGGWLPFEFFEEIGGPGGGDGILGVTFTFIWGDFDGEGNFIPSDIDNNGKFDVAFREIYMNNNFAWEIGNDQGPGVYDMEAVMIHEQGHSLSQAHFGEISLNPRGKLIISPKGGDNIMLAAFSSNWLWEGFHGTDTGGHCSIWSTWPIQ